MELLIASFIVLGIAVLYYLILFINIFLNYITGKMTTSKYYLPEYIVSLKKKYPLLFKPDIIKRLGEEAFLFDIKTDINKLIQNNKFHIYEKRHIEKVDNNKYDVILKTNQYVDTIMIMVIGYIYIDDVNKLKYNEGFYIETLEDCTYYADNGVSYRGHNNDAPYTIVCLKYDTIKIK